MAPLSCVVCVRRGAAVDIHAPVFACTGMNRRHHRREKFEPSHGEDREHMENLFIIVCLTVLALCFMLVIENRSCPRPPHIITRSLT